MSKKFERFNDFFCYVMIRNLDNYLEAYLYVLVYITYFVILRLLGKHLELRIVVFFFVITVNLVKEYYNF